MHVHFHACFGILDVYSEKLLDVTVNHNCRKCYHPYFYLFRTIYYVYQKKRFSKKIRERTDSKNTFYSEWWGVKSVYIKSYDRQSLSIRDLTEDIH